MPCGAMTSDREANDFPVMRSYPGSIAVKLVSPEDSDSPVIDNAVRGKQRVSLPYKAINDA
jgi:hypothetical protein